MYTVVKVRVRQKLDVFTETKIQIAVFFVMTPCNDVVVYNVS